MINVSMEGVKDALEIAREMITPWQRAAARMKSELNNTLLQAEIQQINAEALLANAKADREKAAAENDQSQAERLLSQAIKDEAEASAILAQREQLLLQIEEARADLKQSQIELAVKIVERYAADLQGSQKTDYVLKLLPILERLINTDLQVGGPLA